MDELQRPGRSGGKLHPRNGPTLRVGRFGGLVVAAEFHQRRHPVVGRQGIEAVDSLRTSQRAEQPPGPVQLPAAERWRGTIRAPRVVAGRQPGGPVASPAGADRAPAAAGPANRRFPAAARQPSIESPGEETSGRAGVAPSRNSRVLVWVAVVLPPPSRCGSTTAAPTASAAVFADSGGNTFHATGSPSSETLRMSSRATPGGSVSRNCPRPEFCRS